MAINPNRWLCIFGLLLIVSSGYSRIEEKQHSNLTQDCIAVVGDSGAYGSVILQLPGQGYIVARSQPFSVVLQEYLAVNQVNHFEVTDLSVPASSLSGETRYAASDQYRLLRALDCQFIIIFPWINDLSNTAYGEDPGQYVTVLRAFIQRLVKTAPDSHVIVIGYYSMQPASFAHKTYGEGLTDENVARFNSTLFSECAPNGSLGEMSQVSCIDANTLFIEAGIPYLTSVYTQTDFQTLVYEPLGPDETAFLDTYWTNNPDGSIIADGVHLNSEGKLMLAAALYQHFLRLDSN